MMEYFAENVLIILLIVHYMIQNYTHHNVSFVLDIIFYIPKIYTYTNIHDLSNYIKNI